VRIDHVIFATRDLEATVVRLEADYGLRAAGGGRHEGLGTGNRIVPLGGGYLEILAQVDPATSSATSVAPYSVRTGWAGSSFFP
jgi:Glyoxalase-like domain